MTAGEKAKALAEQAEGKAKKAMGQAVGNERVTAEGQAEKSTGHARQAKEDVKDVSSSADAPVFVTD
ncbi:CsbD family protein [Streptomyces sp. NPDC004546]|uniref:CsbD family protein n=1 Tax=unclassified Streptomyces TaxID=2593676 RepID=UPI0033B04013